MGTIPFTPWKSSELEAMLPLIREIYISIRNVDSIPASYALACLLPITVAKSLYPLNKEIEKARQAIMMKSIDDDIGDAYIRDALINPLDVMAYDKRKSYARNVAFQKMKVFKQYKGFEPARLRKFRTKLITMEALNLDIDNMVLDQLLDAPNAVASTLGMQSFTQLLEYINTPIIMEGLKLNENPIMAILNEIIPNERYDDLKPFANEMMATISRAENAQDLMQTITFEPIDVPEICDDGFDIDTDAYTPADVIFNYTPSANVMALAEITRNGDVKEYAKEHITEFKEAVNEINEYKAMLKELLPTVVESYRVKSSLEAEISTGLNNSNEEVTDHLETFRADVHEFIAKNRQNLFYLTLAIGFSIANPEMQPIVCEGMMRAFNYISYAKKLEYWDAFMGVTTKPPGVVIYGMLLMMALSAC